MSLVHIALHQVSKKFIYYVDPASSLKNTLIRILKGQSVRSQAVESVVLDNVSFSIKKGEFVGIMGRNGAGKSTLLKIICGIYLPSSGKVEINAPIAPLIEVGAGFSPDLSGYENIFLNAAILGFGKKEAQGLVEAVVKFSELDEHIHKPIKNYSSGMVVRLGFSIAIHLKAPILLVDEIFAVGDLGFQRKCIEKIREMHASGRTIILVTHDPSAVADNCERCIIVDQKKIVFDGTGKAGASYYTNLFS